MARFRRSSTSPDHSQVAYTSNGVDYDAAGRPIAPWAGATAGVKTRLGQAAIMTIGFQVVIWVVFALEQVAGAAIMSQGIVPRTISHLDGIIFAPFIHANFSHIASNASLALIVAFLVGLSGWRVFVSASSIIVIVGGLLTWLFAFGGDHIGASGLIYGWVFYLIVRGVYNRSIGQIVVGIVLALANVALVWGFVPQAGISWEGHLFGAVAGVLAARMLARPRSTKAGA